jgi:hypothetical protein
MGKPDPEMFKRDVEVWDNLTREGEITMCMKMTTKENTQITFFGKELNCEQNCYSYKK